jgi:ABC-type uncharacterized transport system fused permease/ATPase subunit
MVFKIIKSFLTLKFQKTKLLFEDATFKSNDFENALENVERNDLVFFDLLIRLLMKIMVLLNIIRKYLLGKIRKDYFQLLKQ